MAMLAIAFTVPPDTYTYASRPWPAHAVEILAYAHPVISLLAMFLAPLLWGRRWGLALVAILLVGILTCGIVFWAEISTTGLYP